MRGSILGLELLKTSGFWSIMTGWILYFSLGGHRNIDREGLTYKSEGQSP